MINWLYRVIASLLAMILGFGGQADSPAPLTHGELLELDDDAFYSALADRYFMGLDENEIPLLNEVQTTVVIALALDMEVNNGGLCQFFINCPEYAPCVSDCLAQLGADEMKEVFDSFIADNNIDLNSFGQEVSIEAFLELYEQYPFEAFDNRYYEAGVYRHIIVYGREHLDDLF